MKIKKGYAEKRYGKKSIFFFPFPFPKFLIEKDIKTALKKQGFETYQDYLSYYEESFTNFKEQQRVGEIEIMYLILTNKCNLRCEYCFMQKKVNYKGTKIMSLETARKAIDLFFRISSDPKLIILYGGEPLLHPQIKEIIKEIRAHSKQIIIQIITNGTIFNDELANFLKFYNVEIGVSLDGWQEIHNRNRFFYEEGIKKGSFNLVMRTIKKIKEKDLPISVSTTLSRANLTKLLSVVDYIARQGINNIGLNPPVELHHPTESFIRLLTIQIVNSFELLRNKGAYEDRVGRKIKKIVVRKTVYRGCSGYGHQIVVSPEGTVNTCHAFYKLDSPTSWVSLEDVNKIKENEKTWESLLTKRTEKCKYCPFITVCGFGCVYRSFIQNNNFEAVDKIECNLTKKIVDWLAFELIKNIKYIAVELDALIEVKSYGNIINKKMIEILEEINIKRVFFGNLNTYNSLKKMPKVKKLLEKNRVIYTRKPEEICKATKSEKNEIVFIVKDPYKLIKFDERGYKTYLVDPQPIWLKDLIRVRKINNT